MKTVVVTGDLVIDYNLVKHPTAPAYHHVPFDKTVMTPLHGGAWYLERLVRKVCRSHAIKIHAVKHRDKFVEAVKRSDMHVEQCASRAYSVWAPFELDKDGPKNQIKIWRISEFLGCHPVGRVAGRGGAAQAVTALREECRLKGFLKPDVLVIDDLALGFRDDKNLWPEALSKGNPKRIVLKTTSPLCTGPLWEELLKKYADRLTVVLSAAALRARGASISEALSWDKTVEEVVEEFEGGRSSEDLAGCRRVVVHFGMEGAVRLTRCCRGIGIEEIGLDGRRRHPAVDPEAVTPSPARFERFVYDPDLQEGGWKARYPGQTFGATSIITACMVRNELDPTRFPFFIVAGRALAIMRANHLRGAGEEKEFKPEATVRSVSELFYPSSPKKDPAGGFCAAFPDDLLADVYLQKREAHRSDLLSELTGLGPDYVAAVATDVVLRGTKAALRPAPKARYGDYLTADRGEIERINAISTLIQAYLGNSKDTSPLSIAVFGPPGSGKSFAIKQLGSTLPGVDKDTLEFNLAQLSESSGDLHTAFHRVRDAAVHGKIPLVFWDEFDTDNLKWLKYFLSPMQDATFQAFNVVHRFGKAIFVFAGGTETTFDNFRRRSESDEAFLKQKGPDFISRLRGYVDIKGPNPENVRMPDKDPAHIIRRAIILRSLIERFQGHLIGGDKRAAVSTSVIRGFLRAEQFWHGVRSIETVVKMSDSRDARRFGVAELPPRELLDPHVSSDFTYQVHQGELDEQVIETLAEACHRAWYKIRKAKKWRYGKTRDDANRKHPLMLPYAKLSEPDKERNRLTARLTQAKLKEIGYDTRRRKREDLKQLKFDPAELQKLMCIEHDIWLRDHLLNGYQWAASTNDDLRRHKDVAPFENVPPNDQVLDDAIARSIIPALWEAGYTLVRV